MPTARGRFLVAALLGMTIAACDRARGRDSLPKDVRATPAPPPQFRTIGRDAQVDEIRAWDIDVDPSGKGLPEGRGAYARGAVVYKEQCAACHGARGEGIAPNPRLVGREPREFIFGQDPKQVKTIGNYWPYATTLYDYIDRTMPFNTPGVLTPDDVYSVVAYLLAENEIIDRATVVDAQSLPQIRMPARDRFVRDDRRAGDGPR